MKRLVLFTLAFTTILGASAQVRVDDATKTKAQAPNPSSMNDSYDANAKKAPYAPVNSNGEKALGERVLGTTTYDLQTNSAVQDRIAMNANGDISVAWTASEGNNPFNDRGTGYSHYVPSLDQWIQSADYPRIESDRSGWPSIMYDGNGGEILISHSTATNRMRINTRSTLGTGSWSQKDISTKTMVWNRSVMGGTDGNTIHMIAVMNDDKKGDSVNFQNMSTPLLYYRSQDAGQTWDILDSILPGLDSGALGVGPVLSGDCYAIIADGNHVAFGIFAPFNDIILMESTDNGDTWTKTIVENYPFKGYQDFKNKASDTIWYASGDGSGSIVFDNNDVVHLSYSLVNRTNNFAGGSSYQSYNAAVDTMIHYRNSSTPFYGKSAYYIDGNGDSLLNFGKIAFYGGNGLTTFGNLGFGNDSLYLVWSGVSDTIASGIDPDVNMRQIYLMKSGDYGATWTEPIQLTITDVAFSENVMPDIYHNVDDKIRVVFERDVYPSCYVTSLNYTAGATQYTQTSLSDNDIIYLEIDLGGGGIGIGIEETLNDIGEVGVYPNPSHGNVEMTILVYKDINVNVTVTNLNGQIVHTYAGNKIVKGSNKIQMDLNHLEAGMYNINILGEGGYSINRKVVIK